MLDVARDRRLLLLEVAVVVLILAELIIHCSEASVKSICCFESNRRADLCGGRAVRIFSLIPSTFG